MGRIQLFCLPYAGGAASVYSKWNRVIGDEIDLHPIELSGRGRRYKERLIENVDAVVEDLYPGIVNRIDQNGEYAIFGHSLGGILAYELVRTLAGEGMPRPLKLFISAARSPRVMKNEVTYNLPDEAFKQKIFERGGTPKEVLENEELMEIHLPILRADFKAVETYRCDDDQKKLNCELGLICGTNDTIKRCEVEDWKCYTTGKSSIHEIEGGHFFINSHFNEVVDIVKKSLG